MRRNNCGKPKCRTGFQFAPATQLLPNKAGGAVKILTRLR
jgi:hypothetical protein